MTVLTTCGMQEYSMTCPCGDVMKVQGNNRNDAVGQLKAMMTADAIAGHMAEKHPGQPVMSVAECHGMIQRDVQPAR